MYPTRKPWNIPRAIPAKTSITWCCLFNSVDTHTDEDHANRSGMHIRGTGHRLRKKYVMSAARLAWPDGKESFLSSELPVIGRLLLVVAFSTATEIISSIRPEIISLFQHDVFKSESSALLWAYLLKDWPAADTNPSYWKPRSTWDWSPAIPRCDMISKKKIE